MSGLYNMIFGVNQLAGPLLTMIGLNHRKVPRFRDCFLNTDGTEIMVYTRSGGSNRPEYDEENKAMARHAGYLRDEDDPVDATYAIFYFAVPEADKAICRTAAANGHGVDIRQRWTKALEEMRKL